MARTTPEGPAARMQDRTLAVVLREAWERANRQNGLSQRQLAKQVGISHPTLGRWFRGGSVPTYEDVVSIVTALGIVGEEKDSILEMARNPQPNWVPSGSSGLSKELSGVMELERLAGSMTAWQPLFVPGMLQTGSYARAIATASRQESMSDSEVHHLVTLRLGRQHVISKADPMRLHALIGIPALHGQIGGPEVMTEQLRHLLRVGEAPNVTIQLVPVDGAWHGGMLGPFVRYDIQNGQSIVHLEHHGAGLFLDQRTEVQPYHELADVLTDLALSAPDTRAMIEKELELWRKT